MRALLTFLRFSALIAAFGCAAAAQDQGWTPSIDFLDRMATDERLATGVHELSEQEGANLENLVAYEVASARAGGVSGFAGTFSSRRSAEELKATGVDRLSDDQRERLDQHIAGFLADTPAVPYITRSERGRNRGAATDADMMGENDGPKLDVHGSVTLTVGASSEGSFYGGSATAIISDPKGRFHAIISYGTMKGDLPYYGDRYYDYDRRGPIVVPRGP
ncbi:hypothetical protein [Synoicihabitans lomoniglobus]|uniref:Uncharacterized protein n=1 Tax=Synoicihabitans lomoniglobus TaxID=2909285 RepID=A0AAF0A1T7_9BACT|nr:hypothetical protein [Opitutaceae bacterium LMO-M01]WED65332.1 hypothetical protein PXH66_00530 [Opitutaceae bacterium LMO-M01]